MMRGQWRFIKKQINESSLIADATFVHFQCSCRPLTVRTLTRWHDISDGANPLSRSRYLDVRFALKAATAFLHVADLSVLRDAV